VGLTGFQPVPPKDAAPHGEAASEREMLVSR
jgi:hypothetical protein